MWSDLLAFVWAVLSHWQSYATGGVVTALIGLFERLLKKQLPPKVYAFIFVVSFLLAAFFMAWRDEFVRANRVEKENIGLLTRIESLSHENDQLRKSAEERDRLKGENERLKSIPENTQLKGRAFYLASQIRKMAGEELYTQLDMCWNSTAAQGPTGILTTGTDQDKKNWLANQERQRQSMFYAYRQKYHDSYMTDITNLRESLLKHLPPGTRDDTLIYAYRDGFGYPDMYKVANDIERLAGMIPDN